MGDRGGHGATVDQLLSQSRFAADDSSRTLQSGMQTVQRAEYSSRAGNHEKHNINVECCKQVMDKLSYSMKDIKNYNSSQDQVATLATTVIIVSIMIPFKRVINLSISRLHI
jgi:hypothetical protein